MTQAAEMRRERIERLMAELEYEIVRGVMEREIEPDIHMSKIFPCGGRGDNMAILELHVSPAMGHHNRSMNVKPKLRVVD